MATMLYSKNGFDLTKQFESCKLRSYQDQGGVWTIGWGHTEGVHEGMTCTPLEADTWLHQDVGKAEVAVNAFVLVPLTQDEFDALVDFVFNLGSAKFRNSTLLRLLNAGDYKGAAAEFDKWDHIGAKEIAGLLRRREAETSEFES